MSNVARMHLWSKHVQIYICLIFAKSSNVFNSATLLVFQNKMFVRGVQWDVLSFTLSHPSTMSPVKESKVWLLQEFSYSRSQQNRSLSKNWAPVSPRSYTFQSSFSHTHTHTYEWVSLGLFVFYENPAIRFLMREAELPFSCNSAAHDI